MKHNTKMLFISVIVLGVGIFIGRSFRATVGSPDLEPEAVPATAFYSCSMHPSIRQPGPGACPLCGMDLVPVLPESGEEALGPREIRLSARAQQMAEVAMTPVDRRFVSRPVRMSGKIAFDETRISEVSAWVAGRIDRLYVDYTGVAVQAGDHMVELYSPDLLTAQQELIQAAQTVESMRERTLTAAREKLRLLGLNPDQIAAIEEQRAPNDQVTIHSPVGGVVIRKHVREGEYVQTGTLIYTVADLDQVWVLLDAYESDLPWLRYGQEVSLETEAFPGRPILGQISFIDPLVNPATRTVPVRVNVPNADRRLKPGMLIRAVVESRIAAHGRVFSPDLAGKWISPMHPEVIKDEPGSCDVCGMDLVAAESLGYAPGDALVAPLVIPASAALITGARAVVYVADPDREGVFSGREVVLGPRAGDWYLVEEGLQEGERVVHRGNFKIDSALQILAKSSMMNPEGGGPVPGHHHDDTPVLMSVSVPVEFQAQLAAVYAAYREIAGALAEDEAEKVTSSAESLAMALSHVDAALLTGDTHLAWVDQLDVLGRSGEGIRSDDMETIRESFSRFSDELSIVLKTYGLGRAEEVYVQKCPMALDGKGAIWLQDHQQTMNPYFSGGMLRCGSVIESIPGTQPR